MYRIIGGAAIILSCTLASSYITSIEKKKIEQAEAFIELVKYTRDQIDNYATPINKILSGSKDILFKLGIEKEISSFDELLPICTEECKKSILSFSESIGKGYREQQVKMCGGVLSELEGIRKKLVDAYPAKKKTNAALCLAAGGALVIALL